MKELSSSRDLIIWGASGHALVVADIVRLEGLYRIVAFFSDRPEPSDEFCGVPLLTNRDQLRTLRAQGKQNLILAFGHCNARLRLASVARTEGFELGTAVHPKAIIAEGVRIGAGSVISAGVVINPASAIGENVIVNTSASIDHEGAIEDGAHIGPGAHLGGRVKVGRAAWIGIGAIIKDRVRVGADSIVGAGSVVLHDVPEKSVVVGVPAKVIRRVRPDEN